MNLTELQAWMGDHYALWINIGFAFLVILAVLILNKIVDRILVPFINREASSGNIWRNAILESLNPPVHGVIWIVGLTLAVGFLTRDGGFTLLDTQWTTPHLEQFGAIEIPRREYLRRLAAALEIAARFGD